MAIGQGAQLGGFSYLALGRETTYGTAVTGTAGLQLLSSSMKPTFETKILEEISRYRTYAQQVQMSRHLEGEVDLYFRPLETACSWLLQGIFGGTVTSATSAGETVGGGGLVHTQLLGNLDDQTYKSFAARARMGASTGGEMFEFSGMRVDEATFSAEIDDPLKLLLSLVGADYTVGVTDIESVLTAPSANVLLFSAGRFSLEGTFASLTSSSFWHVQSVEFKLKNNLKTGPEARRLGSDKLVVLPIGMATFELKAKIRFDTTTAYDSMVAATQYAAEFEFLGNTITGSVARQGLKIQFPKVYIADAGFPEIGGPDEVLQSEVTFNVLRDDSSVTGYAVRALLTTTLPSPA